MIFILGGLSVLHADKAQETAGVADPSLTRFGFGIGYPDLRARANLWGKLDGEAKVALGQGEQAYSARLYWGAWKISPVELTLGAEAGYLKFDGQSTLSGDGKFAEPFAGLEYVFARRFRLGVDIGPAWINVTSRGEGLGELQWTYNTAIYYFLF